MADDLALSGEMRAEILSNFERYLRAGDSPIMDSVDAHEQLLDRVRSVLDEVDDNCRKATENADYLSTPSPSIATDPYRAIEGVYPAESLHAANVLFEIALPVVLRAFPAIGAPNVGAALVLHRAVMGHIAASAVSSTGFMLKTIRDSHRAELARLARDLHDHTAHAIGVAIQNLELHELHVSRDVTHAREKLHRAREAMRQASDGVRRSCAELRTIVQPDKLERALTEYLAANADSNVVTSVTITGDITTLSREASGEIFVTLREAIRNALMHSGAARLDVTVGISEFQLRAQVSDTGRGFSVKEQLESGGGIGLSSMRERVQLLGGTLRLSSQLGQGTTVEISVPLGRMRR